MTETMEKIPEPLREIIEDFAYAEGREKLDLLLEFSQQMPPLPEWLVGHREMMESVPECMTPVFVHAEVKDGKMTFYFDIPEESPTVRGYAAALSQGLNGATPEEVLNVPADFYMAMGLHEVLTQQRLNGISAILAHMKRLALEEMTKNGSSAASET